MLELAILGLLHEAPMHGYELRKQLATKLGAFRAAISYGSLYPTLRRLKPAGWITEETPAAAATSEPPPLASQRGRVVYKITAEGKERFQDLLGSSGPGDVRRRRLRRALRVLLPHRPGHPAAHPGRPAPARRGAARGPARRCCSRAAERLDAYTPRTPAARPGRLRARGPLAGGAHRTRTIRPPAGGHRPITDRTDDQPLADRTAVTGEPTEGGTRRWAPSA